ncbi:MAG: hypothetical protein JNL24_09825 [Bacteroidia bacterium]|nr:hypothetical protein [Bacteroidia bacterium]
MRPILKLVVIVLALSSSSSLQAQRSAKQLLNAVYSKMIMAKDYSVQANIKVDLPFVKMLPIDAKIYFKQKDKFKVESKSIAIVPRQGFDQITKMLTDTSSFDALISGTEMIKQDQATIINVIPLSDTSDLILGKLWIDVKRNVVLKSQLTTKSNGTILTEYIYGAQINYGLPDQMIFTVDVKKFKIPKGVVADINNTKSAPEDKTKDPKKGKIYIKLTNYQVNKGIADTVFKK